MIVNSIKFLKYYFRLLPNDILITIIHFLPRESVEHLMNLDIFESQVYHEFLDHIVICPPHKNTTILAVGSTFDSYHEPFTHDTKITLDSWPSYYKPSCVYLDGTFEKVSIYIANNFQVLKSIQDVRISVAINLEDVIDVKKLCKLIVFPNLTVFTVKLTLEESEFVSTIKIEPKKDDLYLLRFLTFAENLNNFKPLPKLVQNLPKIFTSISYKCLSNINVDHLTNLRDLSITYPKTDFTLGRLPESLEHITINGRYGLKFSSLHYNWPSKLKSIVLVSTRIDDNMLVKFSHWPTGLESLTLRNNKFTKFRSIGELPDSLTYLEIGIERHLEDSIRIYPNLVHNHEFYVHNREFYYTFPSSLITMKLSNVKFYHDPKCFIEFPSNLKRLEMIKCLSSINNCIFPASLTYLDLSYNDLDDLTFHEDWQSLDNLRTLKLVDNHLKLAISDWLPPTNLNYLDLKSTKIDNFDIAIFKEENKPYTDNLRVLDISYCMIKKVPDDFYFPKNIYNFDTSTTYFVLPRPLIIRNQRINIEVGPQRKPDDF